jgi:CheY-like chemotaxis protein
VSQTPAPTSRPPGDFVLVLGTTEALRQVVSTILREEGITALAMASSAEALDLLRSACPNLIVLVGTRSKPLDAWAFAESYAQFPPPRAPVICSSANWQVKHHLPEGTVAFLPMPFDFDDLLSLVREHLTNS